MTDTAGQALEGARQRLQRNPSRLISDEPSATDDFGAHSRIADSMYRLIESSRGGKTIALEGRWGSGKSSVIHMLRARCAAGNTLVFQYDAWVHAGDPLRRAFLSSLIDFLNEAKWLPDATVWANELQVLAGKRKESFKTSSPLLTKFGFFFALSVLLVPGGASCLFKGLQFAVDSGTVFFAGWNQVLFWVGLATVLAPAILCIANVLICRWRRVPRPDYLAVMLNKQTTTETATVIESGDQSTIEFQKVFGDLVHSALGGDASRKLVLVIDNLDRVDASEVASIWSLLKSFIDIPRFSKEVWHDRLWVVVPIAAEVEDGLSDNPAQKQFDAAFLDKIFQARFRLPPPILKRWRPYLTRLLHSSLDGVADSDVDIVADIFLESLGSSRLPTPRELILFVNQLAIFSEQWGGAYSLAVGAAYTLEKVEVDLQRLIDGSIPSPEIQRLANEDLRTAYACIYFNTGDRADALDLLQRPLAAELLDRRDAARMAASLGQHEGFAHVLQRVLAERLRSSAKPLDASVAELTSVAQALRLESLTVAIARDTTLEQVVPYIHQGLMQISLTLAAAPGGSIWFAFGWSRLVSLLLEATPSASLVNSLLRSLSFLPADDVIQRSTDVEFATRYQDNLARVLSISSIRDGLARSSAKVILATQGVQFAHLLDSIDDVDKLDLAKLVPLGGPDKASEYLVGEVAKGTFSEIDRQVIRWLSANGDNPGSRLLQALATYESDDVDDLATSVLTVVDAIISPGAVGDLGASLVIGDESRVALGSIFQTLMSAEKYEAAARLALLFLLASQGSGVKDVKAFLKALAIAPFLAKSSESPALTSQLAELISALGLEEAVLVAALAIEDIRPLYLILAKTSKIAENAFVTMGAAQVVNAVDRISTSHFAGTEGLVDLAISAEQRVGRSDALSAAIVSSRFRWRWLSRAITATHDEATRVSLIEVARRLLSSIARSDWSGGATNFTWRDQLATEIVELDSTLLLPHAIAKITDVVEASANGTLNALWTEQRVAQLMKLVRKAGLQQVARNEVARVLGGQTKIHASYWNVVGPLFITQLSAAQGSLDFPSFVSAIVKSADTAAVRWLSGCLKQIAAANRRLDDKAVRADLHEQLRSAADSVTDSPKLGAEMKRLKSAISGAARLSSKRRKKHR